MSGMTLALLMQFCVMTEQDMYAYTIPHRDRSYYYQGQMWDMHEGNRLSGLFQDVGLAGVYVFGTSLAVEEVSRILGDPWDKLILAGATLVEIRAIHSWAKFGLGPREVSWEIGRITF